MYYTEEKQILLQTLKNFEVISCSNKIYNDVAEPKTVLNSKTQ